MSKLLYLDVETTGTDPKIHGIHEIGFFPVIDDVVHPHVSFNIRPFKNDIILEKALAVTGVNAMDFQTSKYWEPHEFFNAFCEYMKQFINPYNKNDKFTLVGYNLKRFDFWFLYHFYQKIGNKYFYSWFDKECIDAMLIAGEFLKPVRKDMENFKLHTVARQLGVVIEESRLHTPEYDLILTREIILRCQSPKLF